MSSAVMPATCAVLSARICFVVRATNCEVSRAEICKALNISKEDFDERSKNDAVFRKLISFGRTIALAWWEEKLRKVSFGEEKGNPAVIKLVMQNRYGWTERSETDNKSLFHVDGMTLDEAKQELRKLAPTLSNILEDKQFKH